ncbi:cysteine--tRNA ligase [bacterium]|nr:cysteine--tRNA ligase [bacterium]
MIKITNTLSGKKEEFKPIEQKKATMYVCGITPYDFAHVGHGRVAVIFDTLYRLLKFLDFEVKYCRNFTDIDDKLLKKAQQEFNDQLQYGKVAQKYIDAYTQDVKALNCLQPDCQPRVTENIQEIIDFVDGLVNSGHAYVAHGDVYFSIKKFPVYGRLSKHKLKDLRAGSRVEVNDKKQDPLDFVLWKGTEKGTFWKSPWGYGRPGWHIECSVMASKYLGKQIDIHGGGMDLIFPHHENEIAQSEALNKKTFANYWMHNAFVRIDKEKMSKSLGNFFTLKQVFEKFDPMIARFYYVNHHYRAPIDFSFDELAALEKSYRKLCKIFEGPLLKIEKNKVMNFPVVRKMISFLKDDINTPGMLGVVFENINTIKDNEQEKSAVAMILQDILGLSLQPLAEKKVTVTPEIQKLIDERLRARAEKNWAQADILRDKLRDLSFDVQDKKL